MPVTSHWAVIRQEANEDAWSERPPDVPHHMGLAASTGHTHLLPPAASSKASFGFPTNAHPKRGESDGHEPKLAERVHAVHPFRGEEQRQTSIQTLRLSALRLIPRVSSMQGEGMRRVSARRKTPASPPRRWASSVRALAPRAEPMEEPRRPISDDGPLHMGHFGAP